MKALLTAILCLWVSSLSWAANDSNPHGEISLACQQCHSTEGWTALRPVLNFDHAKTKFPLVGRHVEVQCLECHTSLKFAEAAAQCVNCHLDIHHGQFGNGCEACHTPAGWQATEKMEERHQQTRFPLVGVHASVDCQSCHANGQYVTLPLNCKGCHLPTYQETKNPDHAMAGFSLECMQCHAITVTAWKGATYQHPSSFPLTGGHAIESCNRCHAAAYTTVSSECYSCHAADFAASVNPAHEAGQFPHNCAECHNTSGWRPASFDHNLSSFALTGAHVSVNCASCHVGGHYTGISSACWSCHEAGYRASTNPDHETLQLPQDCAQCHTTQAWRPAAFDHNLTRYPLTGAHLSVTCSQCHATGQFAGTPEDCWSCHQAGYAAADNPNHAENQLPHACEVCHTTGAWQPSTFSHAATNFPLTGAHQTPACIQCHTNGSYVQTPMECFACHQADYETSQNPNHAAGNYSHDCVTCHTTDAWQPATFDHNLSQFPLTGAHVSASCAQCHANGQYTGTPTECVACHAADYSEAEEPNHAQNQLPHACQSCHTTAAWSPSTFNHDNTPFPLTGAHVAANCAECHVAGQYHSTPTDCWSCHEANYTATTNPDHEQLQLSHDCATCHATAAWAPAQFDHDLSGFPLTGAHIGASCAQCHANGQYPGTPTDCWSCHEQAYRTTANPDHELGNYSHECAQCHTTLGWQPATFDHNLADFPLTGAHVSVACNQCHTNGQFNDTPTDCWSCHQANYQSADNHAQNQFPHECLQCHTTNGWGPSTFSHSNTDFPLTGAHVNVNCLACHVNGQYQNLATDCWSCHQSNYEGAADPNHVAGNYSHECITCHTTAAWQPAGFDHNLSVFPLTGAHVNLACAQCHANGQFNGTPQECWSCHQAAYEGSDNPNHSELQLPHACEQCHTTAGWTPAQFNHNLSTFPLTGAHVNVSCAECHVNGQYSGTPQECFACHAADYDQAAEPNHAVNQLSHACQECHTTSQWTPSTFSHSATGFPLTGAHVEVNCAQCHVNGQFPGTPAECYTCHQSNFEGVSDPNHVADNFTHACTECHTTVAWTPAAYDHNLSPFPLTGAHVTLACAQCHTNGQFDNVSTACWSCHQADYQGTTNPPHDADNFAHTCEQCHTTTTWAPASFDHNLSGFPLTGAHVSASCTQCHINGQYSGTPTQCWDCHQSDYQIAAEPPHAANQLPHECASCHTTNGWQPSTFNHSNTAFPLAGAHVAANCAQCHINGQFAGTPTQCFDCHQADYEGVNDPNHTTNQFSQECLQCHTVNAWLPVSFDHNLTGFPLTGAHVQANCAQCHVNGQFANTPTDCWSCHQTNYNGTTNPNHTAGNFSHSCTQCHTTQTWTPAQYDHNLSGFPLTGAHVSVSCAQCHVNGQYTGTPSECYSCHQADYQGVQDPNHVSGNFDHSCTQCHTTAAWTPVTYDHNLTGFPLTGAHVNASCAQCHVNGQFNGTPADCWSCHQPDYQSATDPNHAAGQFPHECAECHSTGAWEPSTFNHAQTPFPLIGAHVSVACAACHVNGQFAGTPTACWSCHQSDYQQTTNPNHVAGQYNHQCQSCHTMNGWSPANFNHNLTDFPLSGAHVSATCTQCHINGQYSNTPTDCWSCHQPDYNSAAAPSHTANQLPHACQECHNTVAWEPSTFNHNSVGFPLTGAHVSASCAQCHVNGQFGGNPTQCYACHTQDYQAATNPNHVAGQFSHSCNQCHTTSGWAPAQYDHNLSGFPLQGAHVSVNCLACHIGGQYTGTPTACYACHQADYQGVQNPNHVAGGYDHSCAMCHTVNGWTPANFNHNLSDFPLTGAHVGVSCTQCHTNGQYNGTPTACYACHQPDYVSAPDPNHVQNQLPHGCQQCHTTAQWSPSTFNHNGTSFPLTGAHVAANCAQCHTNGQYQGGTPTDCWSCHQSDYGSATNPNHVTNQFPHACTECHSTNAWQPSTFNHNNTGFSLVGAHVSVQCAQCHVNGQYQNTPTDCYSCHQADYQNTDDPNHQAAGFSHSCLQCHNMNSWDGGMFNHNNTDFPLTGAHVGANCASCHASGQYQNLPADCYSCHQANYQAVTDPNHVAGNYNHTCTQCHTTTAWTPATFNHNLSQFPLTGAHVLLACAQCHANGQYNGTPTDCWSCHQTDYNGAADPGHAANQLPHGCQQCHSTSHWDPSTFNHNSTTFPLAGAHVSVNCAQCHTNGQYQGGTPTQCYSCHQTDFQGVTDPNHVTNLFSHDCLQCHSVNAWNPATFNHNLTDFPLTGAHINATCAQCHVNGQYQGTPMACYSCHQADYQGAMSPNHVQGQFSQVCSQCHTTTAWQPSTFNHNNTDFPLLGVHVSVSCTQCHVNGQYNGTPTDCWSCHQQDYLNTNDPNHQAAGFSHLCLQCHTMSGWEGGTFNHNNTDFPLTGAHVSVNCAACHVNNQYNGTPTACFFCHQADYNGATNPNHPVAGFPTTCQMCHNTVNWNQAQFNHAQWFPIYSGSHQGAWDQCSDCHTNPNNFALFSCIICHEHSNQQEVNQDHQDVQGYSYNSQACYQCHPTGHDSPAPGPPGISPR